MSLEDRSPPELRVWAELCPICRGLPILRNPPGEIRPAWEVPKELCTVWCSECKRETSWDEWPRTGTQVMWTPQEVVDDLLAGVMRLRRAMPRDREVMAVCDELERLLTQSRIERRRRAGKLSGYESALREIAGGAWTDPNGKKVCATHEAIIARRALDG